MAEDLAAEIGSDIVQWAGKFSTPTEMRLEISRQSLYQPLTKRGRDVPCPAQAALAQVVEHIIRNDGVAGSSPASGTIFPTKFSNLPFPARAFCAKSAVGRECRKL